MKETTNRLKREGALVENADTDDPLMLALYREARKCPDELGDLGCDGCPVEIKCQRLWRTVEDNTSHHLNLTEYRRFSQKFYMLRQERNAILQKRGDTSLLPPHKPS